MRRPPLARFCLPALLPPLVSLACVGALLAAAGPATARPAQATASPAAATASAAAPRAGAPGRCADVLLVGLTGSKRRATAAAPFGAMLEPFRANYLARASREGRSVEQVHLGSATAPVRRLKRSRRASGPASGAISRESVTRWEGDLSAATARVVDHLQQAAATCPDQQVVLAGYAQGAMALHRALTRLAGDAVAERIVGAALVSDGDRAARSTAVRLGAPAPRPSGRGVHDHFFRARPDTPPVTWSVCTRGDVVCDVSRTPIAQAIALHRSYATGTGAAEAEGAAGSAWMRTLRWPRPVADWEPPVMVAGEAQSVQVPVSVHRRARSEVRVTAGAGMPPGLSLTQAGELTGSPTRAGTWTLDYTVTSADPAFAHPVVASAELQVTEAPSSRVAAGGEHTCSIRPDQSLRCWGANGYGQVGTGTTGPGPATPARVGSAADWTDVAGGGAHTCGLRGAGQLWCWGLNHQSQLGVGGRQSKSSPVRVRGARDWRGVSAGWFTTCGVRSGGSLWCWGDNSAGQLGDGTTTLRGVPTQVPGGTWRTVSAGGWHTCGIRTDDSLWCWGRNTFGQVGDGTTTNRSNPQRIGGGTSWSAVTTSLTHTCATTARGDVRCWGRNSRGQLGDGTRTDRTAPVRVAGVPGVEDLAAGEGSSCGLDAEGRSWCWGSNAYGFFGDGTRTSSLVPVVGPSGQGQLSAGWLHRCATVSGGVTCWGSDEQGQLGDGGKNTSDAVTGTDGTGDTVAEERATGGDGTTFRLASFNLLGDVHTQPYAHDDEYAPYRMRAEWSRDVLDQLESPDVIGLQEAAPDQLDAVTRALGGEYDAWPANAAGGSVQMSLLWRTSVWEALEKDTITIPFIDWQRKAPVVRLRHRVTGQQIWVINVHNAPRGLQGQRDQAVRTETDKIRELRRSGLPVFLTGDMNEKQRVFCSVLSRTDLDSPAGGSHSGSCRPPREMRIDWIFGSPEAEWSDFSYHVSPLKTWVNDHRIAATTVTLR